MIEKGLLISDMLFDTGVLMRALGDRPDDPRSPLCMELFDAMLEERLLVLIASPTLVELGLGDRQLRPVPRERNVVTIAFDDEAAAVARRCFSSKLRLIRQQTQEAKPAIKFDMLIIAAGVAGRARCAVTLDGPPGTSGNARSSSFWSLAKLAGLDVFQPEDFHHQVSLFPKLGPARFPDLDAPPSAPAPPSGLRLIAQPGTDS